jgi:tripartite-type tricarboxylate transporter receptor subunit TctC
LSGFEAASWVGVVAPGGTSKEIVARLHRDFSRTLEDAEVRDKLLAQGFEIVASTPDEFLRYVAAESDKWAKIVRDYGIKVE